MTIPRSRRWFQLSLKSLFLLTLLVATFFAGYSLALRQAEAERRRAELEAQRAIEEARLQAEALQAQLHWSFNSLTGYFTALARTSLPLPGLRPPSPLACLWLPLLG